MSSAKEAELFSHIMTYLGETHLEGIKQINDEFACLENLEKVVLQYPEIKNLWKKNQPIEDFLHTALSSNKLYMMPRVSTIHSYFIAKLDILSQLSALLHEIEAFHMPLRSSIFSIVCFFMTEKVYFSCLKDETLEEEARMRLVDDLISLWDTALETKESLRYFCPLEHIWNARNNLKPVFGTMDGNTEIIELTMEMPVSWTSFLKEKGGDEETVTALLEFVFSLAYEDIQRERDRLLRLNRKAIRGEVEFRKIFGAMKPAYIGIRTEDPRTFYTFFIERRNRAAHRRRMAVEGPKITIEELYLKYLLTAT